MKSIFILLLFAACTAKGQNINRIEYFIDNDPGFGNATEVTGYTPAATVSDLAFNADISSLAEGFHFLFVRSRDANGRWSQTNRWLFLKQAATGGNIVQIEYFIDHDPGFGNGRQVTGLTPGATLTDFVFPANLNNYGQGVHYFFIRSRDATGRWSITNVIEYEQLAVLPVTWLSFDAQKEGQKAVLKWKTSSEQNSSHFEIERSNNGIQFVKIGSIAAAGNSTEIKSYEFSDMLPVKGTNYYRIRQVDLDGKSSYSTVKRLLFNEREIYFVIANSPSAAPFVKTDVTDALLCIFDAQGKLYKQIVVNAAITTLDLPAGGYIAVLNKNGLMLAVQKFLVVR